MRRRKVEASKGMEVRSDEKGEVIDKLAGYLRVGEADAAKWKLAAEEAVAKAVVESSLEIDELIKSNVQMKQENETLVKENETYRIKLATAMEEAEKVREAVVTEAREEMEDDHDEIEFLTRINADLASQNDRLSKDLSAAEEVVGMTSSIQATLSYLQNDVSKGEAIIAKLEFK